jgi:uncharacterized protein (DUF302 family)
MKYGNSKKVNYNFDEAITKVTEELKAEGFGVLTEIDVKETLKKKLDVDVPRYKILGACNPPLAHKALTAEPEIGLLLPCNVIVYENENSEVNVSVIDAKAMFSVVQREDLEKIADSVNAKLHKVIENL